jgi:tetratricopeptide (TPR) repeat protein
LSTRRLFGALPEARVWLAALAASAVLGSCAYYNIYWMASQEYERATAAKEFSEFWDPFGQKPLTGDALKDIDSCAKRCGKILLLHSKSKWVDDALVLMGNCFALKGEYANAIRKYDELLKFYPSSELVDQARFMRAYTQVLDGSTDLALASIEAIEGEIKTKIWREHAVFLAGKIHQKNADCDGAISSYETYLKDFPGGRRAVDVTLALADCLIKVGRQAQAAVLLEPLAGREDLGGSLASVKLGAAYRKLGQDEKALGIFKRLADNALVDSVRARADIETAITLEGQGKPEEAIEVLVAADSLGKTALGGEARYRIGLVYEQHLSDFAKATAAYDEAAKAATEYGKSATKRGTALKSVAKYEAALADSSLTDVGQLAMNRFHLAETYLLDLGMAPRAETQLRFLSDSLPSNAFTARSKLALGSLLQADGDSMAREYFQAVVDSFPTTVYANVARSHLGLPLVDVPVEVAPAPAADTTAAPPSESAGAPPTVAPAMGPETPVEMGPSAEPGPEARPDAGPGPGRGPGDVTGRPGPPVSPDVTGTPEGRRGGGPPAGDSLDVRAPADSALAPQDSTGGRGTNTGVD